MKIKDFGSISLKLNIRFDSSGMFVFTASPQERDEHENRKLVVFGAIHFMFSLNGTFTTNCTISPRSRNLHIKYLINVSLSFKIRKKKS